MDVPHRYCFARSVIEERVCILTGKLFGLNERLCGLIGIDHQEFLATRLACGKVTNEILESRHRLKTHRVAHGC